MWVTGVRYVAANVDARSSQEEPLVREIRPVPQRTIPVTSAPSGIARPSAPGVRALPGGSFQRPVVLPPGLGLRRMPGGS